MGSHSVTFHPTQENRYRRNPSQTGWYTRFSYPGGMEGWVDLCGWLHTEMVYPPTDGYPSKYQPNRLLPEIELTTCWSQVRRPNLYTTRLPKHILSSINTHWITTLFIIIIDRIVMRPLRSSDSWPSWSNMTFRTNPKHGYFIYQ